MSKMKRIMEKHEMLELRKEGLTLDNIAKLNNISRQAVQQQTKEFKSSALPNTSEISRKLGIPYYALCVAAHNNGIPRIHGKYVWCDENVNIISKMLGERRCKVCGSKLDSRHRVFCSTTCYRIFFNRIRYNQNPEAKEKHRQQMKEYQRRKKIKLQLKDKETTSVIENMFRKIKIVIMRSASED